MGDLVQFLRTRLDQEAEEAKLAAAEDGPDWHYDADRGYVVARREYDMVATGSQDFLEPGRGNFIARHDPTRVLAEVDAKQRLLDEHKPRRVEYLPRREPGCVTCSTAQQWDAQVGEAHCLTLRLLALPYADHPHYRDEWRP